MPRPDYSLIFPAVKLLGCGTDRFHTPGRQRSARISLVSPAGVEIATRFTASLPKARSASGIGLRRIGVRASHVNTGKHRVALSALALRDREFNSQRMRAMKLRRT
jgi:hypothetical protein